MSSNLPPGAGRSWSEVVDQKCAAGHQWVAPMIFELGGGFYCDDADAYCPICGGEDIENQRQDLSTWETYSE